MCEMLWVGDKEEVVIVLEKIDIFSIVVGWACVYDRYCVFLRYSPVTQTMAGLSWARGGGGALK